MTQSVSGPKNIILSTGFFLLFCSMTGTSGGRAGEVSGTGVKEALTFSVTTEKGYLQILWAPGTSLA